MSRWYLDLECDYNKITVDDMVCVLIWELKRSRNVVFW